MTQAIAGKPQTIDEYLAAFLRPRGLIFPARRFVVELTSPASILAFARVADECQRMTFLSFPKALLPAVISQCQASGSSAADIAEQDATHAELIIDGDVVGEDGWVVSVRYNRDCPADLAECLDSVYDLESGGH